MRFFILFLSVWVFCAAAASAEVLTRLDMRAEGAQTVVAFGRANAGGDPVKIFMLGGPNPRIVMDWPHKVGVAEPITRAKPHGHVAGLRFARRGDTGFRLVLDLAPGAQLQNQDVSAGKILVKIQGEALVPPAGLTKAVSETPPAAQRPQDRYFAAAVPYPRLQPLKRKESQRKPIIVIDPGHGGRDPGTIGVKKTYEKGITLKAALELKKQLLATGRYKVIMTRADDTYIAHEERIRIARAGGGDLFISIHADSAGSKSARGASVYTLADRAKKRTKEVINTQNWILDVDLTRQSDPVGDILVDLAQRNTITQSSIFADILISRLSGSTRLIGNTHRRAGYFVLLAPDVPAVLLELGFLSNSSDEKLLKTASHRKKLMRSVVAAINQYFANQKP